MNAVTVPLGETADAQLSVHREGDGAPPIVLLHGAGGTGEHFATLAAYLAPRATYAFSMPGRMRSTGPALESVGAMANVAAQALDALELAEYVLVGHSMGGAVAIELALRDPARVRGVALVSTGGRLRVAAPILAMWEEAARTGQPMSVSAVAFGAHADPAEVARISALEHAIDPRTVLADWRATNAFDRLGALHEVRPAALVLCGDEDVLTPPKYAEHLRARLPRAQLRLVAGVGHMLPFERPDLVAAELEAFVGATSTTP